MNKGALSRIIRDLTNTGDLSVARAVSKHEVLLDDVIQKARGGKLHDFKAWEDLGVSHGLKTAYTDYIKAATESKNMTPAQADNAFYDMLGRDFSPRSQNRKLMSELIRGDGANAAHTPAAAPTTPRQTTTATPAPKPEKAVKAEGPFTDLGDTDHISAREIAREERQIARDIAKAKLAAEATISDSLTKMDSIRNTRGGMAVEAFFKELQDALRTQGKLVIDVNENIDAISPKSVFDKLATRGENTKFSEGEMRVLSTYFTKHHNDAKLAKQASADSDVRMGSGKEMVGSALNHLTKNGRPKGPTAEQRYDWVTSSNDRSSTVALINSTRSRPMTTTMMGLGSLLMASTIYTAIDYESPTPLGNVIPGAIMDIDDVVGKGDSIPGFVEYIDNRYKHPIWGESRALESLKKYYGVENLAALKTNEEKSAVVDKIYSTSPLKLTMTPDAQKAMILYVAQTLYGATNTSDGKPVLTTAELVQLRNENIEKAGETLKQEAQATLKGKEKTEASSAVATPFAPALIGREYVQQGQPAPATTQATPPVTPAAKAPEKEINGAQFNRRLTELVQEETLTKDVSNQLTRVWADTTKMAVAGNEELTAKNLLQKDEFPVFSKNAQDILVKAGVPGATAQQIVQYLTEPSM